MRPFWEMSTYFLAAERGASPLVRSLLLSDFAYRREVRDWVPSEAKGWS
jgi:hypothetical protein